MNEEKEKQNVEKKQGDSKNGKVSSALKKIKSIKNIEIIVAVIAVVVMLVIYFSTKINIGSSSTNKNDKDSLKQQLDNYCTRMEVQLTTTISSIKGAGETKIIINWESSVEIVIAYITSTGSNSSTSAPQVIQNNGNSEPIVLKELYPKALGVIIVCQGGNNVSVKLDIINAVSTLLNITPDKICVYAMEITK